MNSILRVIEPRVKDLGDGFKVRRLLPFHAHKMVGPFVFFDHFGPVNYQPGQGFDVRPHPHIGLATVTYLYEGAIRHQDSLGNDLVIEPGAVNWMTAGKGIVHSERTPADLRENGQTMHGLQTWVALPMTHEQMAPSFVHHPENTLPKFDQNGAQMRLLAGEAWGHRSPVDFPWGILNAAFETPDATEFNIEGDVAEERAIYVAEGSIEIEGSNYKAGTMIVLKVGADVTVLCKAGTKGMICGGDKMDVKRLIEWNFVASGPQLIADAKQEWTRATLEGGTDIFPVVEGDEDDFIPLP